MKSWFKKWGVAEGVVAVSLVAMLAVFFVLGVMGGFAGSSLAAWTSYYGHELAGSFAGFLYTGILFICLVAIALVIWSLGGAFLGIILRRDSTNSAAHSGARASRSPLADPRQMFFAAARRSREMLLILPAIFFVSIAALAMGEANVFAPARLQDVMVIGWEHAIFGTYVFAALGAVHYPHWLITFIIFSFNNMALALIGTGIFLAYVAPVRFRELIIAFCIGILILVPLWLLVPVLSPQDRFIDNVYKLPVPAQIATAVASYHPQPEIAAFLADVRRGKADLPALPTSTIPSAHIFWATIAGYYLFRVRRPWNIVGWIALPFLLASSFGTVLFAQHYFMDVPAGIVIAAIAIRIARGVGKTGEAKKQEFCKQ